MNKKKKYILAISLLFLLNIINYVLGRVGGGGVQTYCGLEL